MNSDDNIFNNDFDRPIFNNLIIMFQQKQTECLMYDIKSCAVASYINRNVELFRLKYYCVPELPTTKK